MTVYRDPFSTHVGAVEMLSAAGVPAPQEWVALRNRFREFTVISAPCTDALAAEICSPTGKDVGLLRAASLAEQACSSGAVEQYTEVAVTRVVVEAVHRRLVELYSPVSFQNYRTVAKRFDAIASAFTKAAKTVDPELESEDVVGLTNNERDAWFAASIHASKLDEALPLLTAAATLAGLRPAETDAEVEIPLCADVSKLHKRKVWQAWDTSGGRCGHWSALLALGAKLRAHSNPEGLDYYSPPRKFVQVGFKGGIPQWHDPEDNPKAPVPQGVSIADVDWG